MDHYDVISSKIGDYYYIYQQKWSSCIISGFWNLLPTLVAWAVCVWALTSHLSPATCWAGRCWWRRRGSQRFGRWGGETDTPPATASGNSGKLLPGLQLSGVRQTRHPPPLPHAPSARPLHPELHPSPCLCPCPRWRKGWCPAEPEGESTGSLWRKRNVKTPCTFEPQWNIISFLTSSDIQMAWKMSIIQTLLNYCSQQLVLGANYCFFVHYTVC